MDYNENLALKENSAYYDITTGPRITSETEYIEALNQTKFILDGVQSLTSAPDTLDICLSYLEPSAPGVLASQLYVYELAVNEDRTAYWHLLDEFNTADDMNEVEMALMMSRRGAEHWHGYLSILIYPASEIVPIGQFFKDADFLTLRWVSILSRLGKWSRLIKPIGQ